VSFGKFCYRELQMGLITLYWNKANIGFPAEYYVVLVVMSFIGIAVVISKVV
jgi:hypothetical protein